jgi:hypothetical protein
MRQSHFLTESWVKQVAGQLPLQLELVEIKGTKRSTAHLEEQSVQMHTDKVGCYQQGVQNRTGGYASRPNRLRRVYN